MIQKLSVQFVGINNRVEIDWNENENIVKISFYNVISAENVTVKLTVFEARELRKQLKNSK